MTSNEIARREPTAGLPEKMEWARALATSNLLPKQYQNNPGNLLFAVEYADALGVSRINAITSIHVIEGKPSASADLIASLVRRAGHKLRVLGDDSYAEAHLIRADDPEFTYKARWDVNKARAAGLLGKGVWKSYPGAMLRSRAITEVARMGASDALFGVIYTPEELGAEVDPDGDVVHTVTTVRPPQSSGADRMRQMLETPTDAPQTSEPEPERSQPEVPGITSAQVKKLAAAMNEAGITDRKAALGYVAEVIGRQVGSRNELTKDEASRVIDALERQATAAAPAEEPVDAEIVDEEGSPETIWSDVLDRADDMGMTQAEVVADFEQRYAMNPGSASAGELAAYRRLLETGEQVPA